jgi:hypothetical protein
VLLGLLVIRVISIGGIYGPLGYGLLGLRVIRVKGY